MISQLLKIEIEKYASRMMAHPLLALARSGGVTPSLVTSYLVNARFLVRNTPRHLHMACRSALAHDNALLARHFEDKLVEEHGHDRWADADLSKMHDLFGSRPTDEICCSLKELMQYLDRVIEEEPSGYLAYILAAEYFTVLAGPEWVRMLDERCGVPKSAMTVVTHHVELDQAHVIEGLHEIDKLVQDQSLFPRLKETLFAAMQLLEGFYDELYAQARPAALRDAS